jgi:hypothetical protein
MTAETRPGATTTPDGITGAAASGGAYRGRIPAARARLLAFYLPQFHPIPENDEWWGKGFTEWTNTAKAKPLFPGHHQPNVPQDLGFYDLRVAESRAAQAEMARSYGVEGFCYWHYWFAGRRLLERPFAEVLRSGEPDFPFCLAWANHSWTGVWYGAPKRVLVEQTYPGMADHEAHFRFLQDAFADPRYVTVDGKPVFFLFRPKELPEPRRVTDLWRTLADREGFPGLHLVGITDDFDWDPREHGFDAVTVPRLNAIFGMKSTPLVQKALRKLHDLPVTGEFVGKKRPVHVYPYEEAMTYFVRREPTDFEYYPCVIPNWDNTPRSGTAGSVLQGSTPELWRRHLAEGVERVQGAPEERRIVVVKSWNEWAEGNYLEPDLRWGRAYLDAMRDVVLPAGSRSAPDSR